MIKCPFCLRTFLIKDGTNCNCYNQCNCIRIIEGPKGDKGDTGEQGVKGDNGDPATNFTTTHMSQFTLVE